MVIRNRCTLRLWPTTLQALPKSPMPSSPFTKGSTVDTVLLPGPEGPKVSPDTQSTVGRVFPRRPSRRNGATQRRHRVRVRQADRDFSRPHPHKKPGLKGAPPPISTVHQHAPRRSWSHHYRSLRDTGKQPARWKHTTTSGRETAAPQPRGRNPPPPPRGGHRPDRAAGAHQAPGPAGPRWARKAPAALLQWAGRRAAVAVRDRSSPPPPARPAAAASRPA